jgi:hypothetical protein
LNLACVTLGVRPGMSCCGVAQPRTQQRSRPRLAAGPWIHTLFNTAKSMPETGNFRILPHRCALGKIAALVSPAFLSLPPPPTGAEQAVTHRMGPLSVGYGLFGT